MSVVNILDSVNGINVIPQIKQSGSAGLLWRQRELLVLKAKKNLNKTLKKVLESDHKSRGRERDGSIKWPWRDVTCPVCQAKKARWCWSDSHHEFTGPTRTSSPHIARLIMAKLKWVEEEWSPAPEDLFKINGPRGLYKT